MTTGQASEDGTVTPAVSRVPPPDEAAYLDGRLMAELSALNYLLGQYVLRHHDADAGRVEPVPIADERTLARSVAAAAEAIRARATRREGQEGEWR
jgi:hypothetical protein